ncbi:MAG: 50S ribosomal protein L1 [Ignavibacteriae bacterium]|nr:50S ribosomal protein L1 [Ignavibacteria bacterium]MBI3365573.1 50S ribosomal protein L1 [Ignavibacteriota bacterium]
MKRSKRYKAAVTKVDPKKQYTIEDAVARVKEMASAKFVEAVDIAVRLGVDPKKADQAVRGTVALPHGIGKEVKVLVLAKPPKDEEARAAGADHVGFQDYIQKIQQGWADVDVIIATPDTMGEVGKLGKVLGPRGLMPNPKSGTVTADVAKAVKEVKAGKMEFRVDKAGILHVTVGKANFENQKLIENIYAFLGTVLRAKPATAKGQYIKSIAVSSTMGPGVYIDKNAVVAH